MVSHSDGVDDWAGGVLINLLGRAQVQPGGVTKPLSAVDRMTNAVVVNSCHSTAAPAISIPTRI